MTMHLLPIYYNDNNTKKKKGFRKAGWQKAEAEHNKWLRSKGVHPDQLENKTKSSGNEIPTYTNNKTLPTSNYVGRVVDGRSTNQYTGDFITGIATMHKSNMVPVNKNTNCAEYATMRRN